MGAADQLDLAQQLDIEAREQQAMNLVTTDATMLNLGFATGEEASGLGIMAPDLFLQ